MSKIAVIRISGMVGQRKTIEDTLYRLKLRRKYACIVFNNPTPEQLGMIKKFVILLHSEIFQKKLTKN